MRGEHICRNSSASMAGGSAPHARGTRRWRARRRFSCRFSPACAGNTRESAWRTAPAPVQPRMRGEHLCTSCLRSETIGSAPHARGTRQSQRPGFPRRRFSPACAGNTERCKVALMNGPVQPRMRGEHFSPNLGYSASAGSAPHARGTQLSGARRQNRFRFSPACAGNTRPRAFQHDLCPVQPRMRGEHAFSKKEWDDRGGSAPHARGTQCGEDLDYVRRRFSPACAGNTPRGRQTNDPRTVQPRMRGEHKVYSVMAVFRPGSAPHARGTRRFLASAQGLYRFSPACAGNTPAAAPRSRRSSVQPRMRGEHPECPPVRPAKNGSAPHARGTHWRLVSKRIKARFSPACAGNTPRGRQTNDPRTVQPRMRGEHKVYSVMAVFRPGSAPHARGTHLAKREIQYGVRFSPACAGNTQV